MTFDYPDADGKDSAQISGETPGLRLSGSETSGGDLTIRENAGTIELYNEATDSVATSWNLNPGLSIANTDHAATDHEAGGSLEVTHNNLAITSSDHHTRPVAGTLLSEDANNNFNVTHTAADHEAGGSLEVTHNNLTLTASDHHTPSTSSRDLQPEGMQAGLAADATGVQYSGAMYQYIDGALLADGRAVYLEAATNSSAGDEAVTVEVYDPAGAAVLDSLAITGGSTRSRSGDISASLTADSEVQVRWNVTTASATAGATFDAVGARFVVE